MLSVITNSPGELQPVFNAMLANGHGYLQASTVYASLRGG